MRNVYLSGCHETVQLHVSGTVQLQLSTDLLALLGVLCSVAYERASARAAGPALLNSVDGMKTQWW